jgi:exosome complex RNA-binding protein Rrp4
VEVLRKSASSKAEIFVKDRELVLPGQALAKGSLKPEKGVYVDKDGVVRSYMVGLAEISKERVELYRSRGATFLRPETW